MTTKQSSGSSGDDTTGTANGTTTTSNAIDSGRLTRFFGVLVALVIGFTAVVWAVDVSILAAGPLYMFTPAIAAVVVCRHAGISLSTVGLRIGRKRWLAIAAVIWLPLAGVIFVLSLGVPGVGFDSSVDVAAELGLPGSGPGWSIAAVGLMVAIGATVNAIFAFGEEFGWRGYLLWELSPLGFWKASLVIGTVWGLWHAPLIVAGLNYPSFPYVGVLMFTVVCIAISPLFTYLVLRGESVLPAAVFHGVFNAAGLVLVTTESTVLRELVVGEGGVVGVFVFGLVALAIAVAGTPALTRAFASMESQRPRSGRSTATDRQAGAGAVGEQG